MKADRKYFIARNQKSLGAQLRISRSAANVSNIEMARSVGLPSPTLSKWELNRQRLWCEADCKLIDAAYAKMSLPSPEWHIVDAGASLGRAIRRGKRRQRVESQADVEQEAATPPTKTRRASTPPQDVALDDADIAVLLRLFRRGLVDEQVVVAALKGGA